MRNRASPDKRLTRLLETTLLLNSIQDQQMVISHILKAVREVMQAEASSLLLVDPERGELFFEVTEGGHAGVKEIRLKIGEGIAGWVAQHGKPLRVNNVRKDKRFTGIADRATGFKTKGILAVPTKIRGTVTGVLEAINKRRGNFTLEDQKYFEAFAAQASVALENARLYSMAFTDTLTKAFGRRYFDFWMEQELARLKRYGGDLSLALMDLDHFKKLNDTYGHRAGDFVLVEAVRAVKQKLRACDFIARYGGEEFTIIFPNTALDGAALAAQRICDAVAAQSFLWENQKMPVTASIGVASVASSGSQNAAQLVELSDQALYKAKDGGRNRVCLSGTTSAENGMIV